MSSSLVLLCFIPWLLENLRWTIAKRVAGWEAFDEDLPDSENET